MRAVKTETTYQPRFDHLRPGLSKLRYPPARVGDRQRSAVTDFLGLAFSEGFITRAELDTAADRALRARTEDQLAAALNSANLPDKIRTEKTEASPALPAGPARVPADAVVSAYILIVLVIALVIAVAVLGSTLL